MMINDANNVEKVVLPEQQQKRRLELTTRTSKPAVGQISHKVTINFPQLVKLERWEGGKIILKDYLAKRAPLCYGLDQVELSHLVDQTSVLLLLLLLVQKALTSTDQMNT